MLQPNPLASDRDNTRGRPAARSSWFKWVILFLLAAAALCTLAGVLLASSGPPIDCNNATDKVRWCEPARFVH